MLKLVAILRCSKRCDFFLVQNELLYVKRERIFIKVEYSIWVIWKIGFGWASEAIFSFLGIAKQIFVWINLVKVQKYKLPRGYKKIFTANPADNSLYWTQQTFSFPLLQTPSHLSPLYPTSWTGYDIIDSGLFVGFFITPWYVVNMVVGLNWPW